MLHAPRRRFGYTVAFTLALIAPTALPLANAAAPAYAAQAADTKETVALTFIHPSEFIAVLKEQPVISEKNLKKGMVSVSIYQAIKGLRRLSPRDLDGSLDIEGTPEAIAEVKSLVEMSDHAPREAILTLSITRVYLNADGVRQRKAVGRARVNTTNNAATVVEVAGGYHVSVTPHMNGDNSVSLAVDSVFPESDKQDGIAVTAPQYVRIMNGDKRRFRFAAAATRPETRAMFGPKGKRIVVNDDRDFERFFKGQAAVLYYVDVTPYVDITATGTPLPSESATPNNTAP